MAKPIWLADIGIDAPLALRLVSAQFPELGARNAEPFGSGWDNAAFLIDEKVVFRFPRRRSAAGFIEREVAILPRVAPHLPLAISAPRFAGSASPAFPWKFAGYDLIEGVTACSITLSDEARSGLAEPLAHFLRALHDVDPQPLASVGLPPDELGRLDHDKRLGLTMERIPTLTQSGLGARLDAFVTWLETHPPVALKASQHRLVHGDLYARHVLLDVRLCPIGVIDWGDVHRGDPALDIAIAHLMLPSSAYPAFRAAYGPLDERTWTAARYRAIYHAIVEVDYGIRSNDAAMCSMGLAALRLMETALD